MCELGISSFITSAGLGASQGGKMAISSTNNAFSNNKKMLSELDPGGARGYTYKQNAQAEAAGPKLKKAHKHAPKLVRGR